MPIIINPIGGGGGGGAAFPADGVKRYAADISGTTGSITAATHGLGATKDLDATFFRDDGTDNAAIDIPYLVTDSGTVTWTAGESVTGRILIMGRG